MSKYVDGYLIVLPKKNAAKYMAIAKEASRIWMDNGALAYSECLGEDLVPPYGLPFGKLAKVKKAETVVFAWVVFKSRAHRDKVNAAVMEDPRMQKFAGMKMPFDMKRMSYGGFEQIVSL